MFKEKLSHIYLEHLDLCRSQWCMWKISTSIPFHSR